MCSPVTCRVCGNTTWAGCGQHVDAVRAGVPDDLWCPGHDDAPQTSPRELIARLFRR